MKCGNFNTQYLLEAMEICENRSPQDYAEICFMLAKKNENHEDMSRSHAILYQKKNCSPSLVCSMGLGQYYRSLKQNARTRTHTQTHQPLQKRIPHMFSKFLICGTLLELKKQLEGRAGRSTIKMHFSLKAHTIFSPPYAAKQETLILMVIHAER